MRINDFDLILMDIRMPVMDGLTATRSIRKEMAEKKGRHIPILAFTAGHEDGDHYADCGLDEILPKPVRISELIDRLEAHLQKQNPPESIHLNPIQLVSKQTKKA